MTASTKILSSLNARDGAVALAVILLVSFLVLEITIMGLLTAYFSSQQGASQQLSLQAYAAARSGISDALLRLVRNPLFTSPTPYALSVDGALANVTVVDASGTQIIAITSVGQRLLQQTKLTATATVDLLSGSVFLQSISQSPAH
ncbi:MAG: hypothetical protein WC246_01495 [Candidatus Paceibacterota bacterium]